MRFIIGILFSIICITAVSAATIEMFGQEKYGYKQPMYLLEDKDNKADVNPMLIKALVKEDDFPFSSQKQGSVFYKVFKDFLAKGHTRIIFLFEPNKYDETALEFERDKNKEVNALFGVYYKEMPLYKNRYVYPAIAFNNVHIIMPSYKRISISGKNGLKEYKGVHAATDKVSEVVAKEFKDLNIKEVEDFPTAFEELLTGKADYMVASYYPSLIAIYKLGIRKYVVYSHSPLWKMPMFLRVHPSLMNKPQMQKLVSYLKSEDYKKSRDAAFEEVIEIYKNNTAGIVPPTYKRVEIEETSSAENNSNTEDAQTE